MDAKQTAAHLAIMAQQANDACGRAWLKLYKDAVDAKCLKEFGLCLKSCGLEDEARHFLGTSRMKILAAE